MWNVIFMVSIVGVFMLIINGIDSIDIMVIVDSISVMLIVGRICGSMILNRICGWEVLRLCVVRICDDFSVVIVL